MTIAAGFVCSDGILLASDTLYSGDVLRYGRKFWVFEVDGLCVVFGGAGTERGLLRTRDEIRRRLVAGMPRHDVLAAIDAALLDVNTRLRPSDNERTYALVAIRDDEGLRLYHNEDGGSMLSPIDHLSQCVGYAQSIGTYFARSLFRADVPLRWAKVVAAHLIRKCKDHSAYCDGDTHLVELPIVGAPRFIENQIEIATLEKHLEVIDDAMRIILLDPRANDDTLFERAKALSEAVERLGKEFFISLTGVAAISFTGNLTATVTPPAEETKG